MQGFLVAETLIVTNLKNIFQELPPQNVYLMDGQS